MERGSKNQEIAAVGFMSYEFKDYIYKHLDFDKKNIMISHYYGFVNLKKL